MRLDDIDDGYAERYAADHISVIRAACVDDIATFRRAALVCMLSARRPFDIVGDVVSDVLQARKSGDFSRWPSAAQKRGIEWIESPKGEALRDTLATIARTDARKGAPLALAMATQCPALGLAKGGFICQMMGVDVGCLDTHNVDKYALSRDAIRLRKEGAAATKARVVLAYVELCQRLGGSHKLWGAWCEYLAQIYPDTYASGFAVSRLHIDYVKGV